MILKLDNLARSFGSLKAVDGVALEVARGEALGIIGPNGAGKSTLFNLITGLLKPDTGTVHFNGNDITHTPPRTRCIAGIGRSFQIPHPFENLTVFENLLVAAIHGRRQREADVVIVVERIGVRRNRAARRRLARLDRLPVHRDPLPHFHSRHQTPPKTRGLLFLSIDARGLAAPYRKR